MISPRFSTLLVVAAFALNATSCTDPVLDDDVDAQGNETEGIDRGQFHRAGQKCVVCHQENGEASDSAFTLAGTIFAQPKRQVGVSNATIRLTDSDGSKFLSQTNCVGNFFIKAADWQPKFPILVEVFKNGTNRSMRSPIGREADCAGCHVVNPSDPLAQVPHIYLYGSDEPGQINGDDSCPVDPVRPGSP